MPGKAVARRDDERARFTADGVYADVVVEGGRLAERHIDRLEPGAGRAVGEGEVAKGELGFRVGLGERRDQLAGGHRGGRADEPDLEDLPLSAGQRFGRPADLAFGLDGGPGLLEERLARVGQCDSSCVALEQSQPEFGLQLGDRLGERGLGHEQPPRRRGYLTLLGDGDEIAEMIAVEGHSVGDEDKANPNLQNPLQRSSAHRRAPGARRSDRSPTLRAGSQKGTDG